MSRPNRRRELSRLLQQSFKMFSISRTKYPTDSFSKHRAGKSVSNKSKRSFRDHSSTKRPADLDLSSSKQRDPPAKGPAPSTLNSAVITISIGHSPPRLFAAHEDILNASPFFQSALRSQYYNSSNRQLYLPDEVPEIFSSVLEFLYKGDYFPKLEYDPRRGVWTLENASVSPGNAESTVWIPPPSPTPNSNGAAAGGTSILKDTAIYCTAEKYGLQQLKRLALRKQGLQAGIPVSTILASARYAYAHTPDNDSKLRAHYLHLIIRSRDTFKRSGTMQMEMGMMSPTASPSLGSPTMGTGLWFDLFVAMCNHLDDMEKIVSKSPRSAS